MLGILLVFIAFFGRVRIARRWVGQEGKGRVGVEIGMLVNLVLGRCWKIFTLFMVFFLISRSISIVQVVSETKT